MRNSPTAEITAGQFENLGKSPFVIHWGVASTPTAARANQIPLFSAKPSSYIGHWPMYEITTGKAGLPGDKENKFFATRVRFYGMEPEQKTPPDAISRQNDPLALHSADGLSSLFQVLFVVLSRVGRCRMRRFFTFKPLPAYEKSFHNSIGEWLPTPDGSPARRRQRRERAENRAFRRSALHTSANG